MAFGHMTPGLLRHILCTLIYCNSLQLELLDHSTEHPFHCPQSFMVPEGKTNPAVTVFGFSHHPSSAQRPSIHSQKNERWKSSERLMACFRQTFLLASVSEMSGSTCFIPKGQQSCGCHIFLLFLQPSPGAQFITSLTAPFSFIRQSTGSRLNMKQLFHLLEKGGSPSTKFPPLSLGNRTLGNK